MSRKNHTIGRSARQGGWSLIELTVTLSLLMGIALFGVKTMGSAFMLQNWSIGQSMTDAYAGIETAYAQRYVFADIDNNPNGRWGPQHDSPITTKGVPIGQTPLGQVTADVTRTYHKISYTDPVTGGVTYNDPVTGARSYLLESYIVYQEGPRKYCKVSKVYRSE